jgi:hypothetical protein
MIFNYHNPVTDKIEEVNTDSIKSMPEYYLKGEDVVLAFDALFNRHKDTLSIVILDVLNNIRYKATRLSILGMIYRDEFKRFSFAYSKI